MYNLIHKTWFTVKINITRLILHSLNICYKYYCVFIIVVGNAQSTMVIIIKPMPGEFPSSEEIDKPMNQQDPGTFYLTNNINIFSPK